MINRDNKSLSILDSKKVLIVRDYCGNMHTAVLEHFSRDGVSFFHLPLIFKASIRKMKLFSSNRKSSHSVLLLTSLCLFNAPCWHTHKHPHSRKVYFRQLTSLWRDLSSSHFMAKPCDFHCSVDCMIKSQNCYQTLFVLAGCLLMLIHINIHQWPLFMKKTSGYVNNLILLTC